ncbi:hypothetical protein [Aquisediminimonas sediminicola]|uniref:hypothetical protein n=1 Tax=Alteraquisediminimonas sediminicola TaxID=2676787 RepID=UPI001C8ECD39|nr:hypothetical protein [Aquisediminimonas sediminicola]
MMHDLKSEIFTASSNVRQPHLDRLLSLGVSPATLGASGSSVPPFGVMACERLKDGYYQPCEGREHVIQPIYEMGDVIDLVAWRTDNPASWALRTGLGWCLGHYLTGPHWDCDQPTRFYATPLDWLRGGADGICVLDWGAPEIRELANLHAIEADPDIADHLRSILSRPVRVPQISTRKAVLYAA